MTALLVFSVVGLLPSLAQAYDYEITRLHTVPGQSKGQYQLSSNNGGVIHQIRGCTTPMPGSQCDATVPSSPENRIMLHVPIDLPSGAVIRSITVYGDDNSSVSSVDMMFRRSDYSSQGVYEVQQWSSVNTSDWWTSPVLNFFLQSNASAYWVDISIPGSADLEVWTMEIQYTP